MITRTISTPKPFLAVLAFCVIIASCGEPTKQLTYAQDLTPGEFVKGAPGPVPTYLIHAKDNLYIKIITTDPDLNKISDPAETLSTGQINYDGQASKNINGNIVGPDGAISLPLIGKIDVEGKSVAECEELITREAKRYLKDVTVKVRLLNYKITVLGEVKMPGVFYNYNDYYTILDALSNAQGTSDFANLESVLVMRSEKEGVKTYNINLKSKNLLSSGAFYLLPNDVVIVPPGKNKNVQQRLPIIAIAVGSLSALLLLLNFLK